MAYTCDLGSGQRLYLDNVGQQTAVTLASGGPGQQQQSGSQFTTGAWTHPPELFRTAQGVVVKLTTVQGPHYLQLQGNQWGSSTSGPNMASAQQMQTSQVAAMPGQSSGQPMTPMQPMQPMSFDANPPAQPPAQPTSAPMPSMEPMQPMQPMTLGNMTLNANPMEMRMGNMAMSMGQPASAVPETHTPAASAPARSASSAKSKFCSQCGTPVQPSDRFCANCGHGLGN